MGGKPSKGTPRDRRLAPNKGKSGKSSLPFGGKRAPLFGRKSGGKKRGK